ncbi:MAG: response regulator [Rhodobacteraceae bacterium]|nr:response regulator [Paracoccaceae bacterium]
MADELSDFLAVREPTADHPLLGLTILLVEDSRLACDAIRLLCQRSGARLRRADCLRSARRHLAAYRPSVVIVDLGLPDGSGLELIAELCEQRPRVGAILATSGADALKDAAFAAGADGFLPKPIESLSAFRRAILDLLPGLPRPQPARATAGGDLVHPDPLALRDDLSRAAELMDAGGAERGYLAQFLTGVALGAHDAPLHRAAEALAQAPEAALLDRIDGLVRARLATGGGL